MSELSLVLSEKFTKDDATSIRAALGRHLQVGNPRSVWRRSIDPPSTIELLGAVAAWQILVKPAAAFAKAFFSTLGKKTAEAAWGGAVEWRKNRDLKPLVDVVTALIEAADRVGGEVRICVGLKIPVDDFEAEIWTGSRDPSEVARMLSAFLVRMEKISDAAQAAIDRGREPVGPFFVELEQDGSVTLRWRAAPDFKAYEEHIP